MATKILAVNVLLAFGVCVFAVTLAVLLAPSLSSPAVLEWLSHTPPCGGVQRLSRFERLIHRSAWKVNSANFAQTEFSEVRFPI